MSDYKIYKKVNARKIWDQFVESSWDSAEPGALFWDTIKMNTPSDAYDSVGFGSVGVNNNNIT
jgi:ribonucleoside-diphosphate reductase alpha chain